MNSNDFRKAVIDAAQYLAFYEKDVCTFSKPIEVEYGFDGERRKVIPTVCLQDVTEDPRYDEKEVTGDGCMGDYTESLHWAVVYFIPRGSQDDKRDKLVVSGLFPYSFDARDNYLARLPNQEVKRYVVCADDLKEFERFYNFVNDLKEQYCESWVSKLDSGNFAPEQKKRFCEVLEIGLKLGKEIHAFTENIVGNE